MARQRLAPTLQVVNPLTTLRRTSARRHGEREANAA